MFSSQQSNDMELKALWERYVATNARCSEVEGQKQAKSDTKVCYWGSFIQNLLSSAHESM